jgi:TorA maturation chaperone TorD
MRSELYLFASGLFNQPTKERLAGLQNLLTHTKSIAEPDVPWRETLIALEPELNYNEELETEYSRLFILAVPAVPAQPFGAYWLENDQCLLGDSTLEVKNMMVSHGIEVTQNSGLLPDHIVSELEFMAYLADNDEQETWQTQQQLFVQHIHRWMPQFTEALRAANPAPIAYYRLAADYLDQLIASERPLFFDSQP